MLIGESANREIVDGIARELLRQPEIERMLEVLTMHFGPAYLFAGIRCIVAAMSARQVQALPSRIERAIRSAFPAVKRVFFEAHRTRPARRGNAP